MNKVFFSLFLLVLVLPITIHADCTCDQGPEEGSNKDEALKLKIIAIACILVAGGLGVSFPILGKFYPKFSPGNDLFFVVKAFAAGVIFSTGCVHVLPDAFDNLTNPCLSELWTSFPFGGMVLMLAAIATMLLEQIANVLYQRMHFGKAKATKPAAIDIAEEEKGGDQHDGHVHVHTHATHGHAHGAAFADDGSVQLLQDRIIAQILETGIVVHSVIIGISLGTSQSPKTIEPLVVALSFHQLFEGMGLGGCISQAKFNALKVGVMSIFFTLTTPVGIAIGFAISNSYNENSPKALIVEGLLNAASAGILIYMALVDLIQETFKGPRLLNNLKLLLCCDVALLLGLGCMTLLAKWA